MVLSLTSLDKEGRFHKFTCWYDNLEVILDALSEISTKGGDQLLTAELLDDGNRISLPLDAFDGQVFSKSIQLLKAEWQQLLSEPVNQRSMLNQRLIAIMRQRIKNQQVSITQFKLTIGAIEQQLRRLQSTLSREPTRSTLIVQSEVNLTRCQQLLARAQLKSQSNSSQLTHLLSR